MNNKRLLTIFLWAIIILGLFFRIISLDKEFSAEETDFVNPAIAIKNTGHPIFYNSELYPEMTALLHPPMYSFLMSLIFKISVNEILARSINVFFSLLTSIFIFLFCLKILGKERGKIIGAISAAFFLINYYILSSSILIDIDVLSSFFVFSFVFFTLRNYQTNNKKFLFFAGISLIFGLANRYPMAILTFFFVGIYFFLNKDLKKDFKEYLVVGFFSLFIFIFVWTIYSTIIEPGNFFSFIIHNSKLGAEQFLNIKIYIGSFLLNISQLIRLFTFPAVILMIWSFIYFTKRKTKLSNILLLYILPILIFFIILPRPAFGYPRYFMTIFPGVSILIGMFLYINLKDSKINKKLVWTIALSFFVSLAILLILNPQPTIYYSKGLIKATNLPDFIFNLLASLPLILILFLNDKRKMAIFILLSLTLSYSLFFNIKFIDYNTHIKEVGAYIQERTSENETIIVPKAVGYYSERKFHINDNNKPKLDFSLDYLKEYFKKSFKNREMDNEFFWSDGLYGGLYPPTPSQEILKNSSYIVLYHQIDGYNPEKKIGEFYIYKT